MAERDFAHLTPDEKINGIKASKLPDHIRSKYHGEDVREAIAQSTELSIQLGINMGLSPDDAISWARKLQESVSQSDFDGWVATLLDGGPSIFMNTLSELKATYPNGAPGVALVRETDPAKIYVWNGSAWEDFGDYQGIKLAEGSVTDSKLHAKTFDKFASQGVYHFNSDDYVKDKYWTTTGLVSASYAGQKWYAFPKKIAVKGGDLISFDVGWGDIFEKGGIAFTEFDKNNVGTARRMDTATLDTYTNRYIFKTSDNTASIGVNYSLFDDSTAIYSSNPTFTINFGYLSADFITSFKNSNEIIEPYHYGNYANETNNHQIIKSEKVNLELWDKDNYWGTNGKTPTTFAGQIWYASPEISVSGGEYVYLFNWYTSTEGRGSAAITYYTDRWTRINYDSSGMVYADGVWKYKLPMGVTKIGLSLVNNAKVNTIIKNPSYVITKNIVGALDEKVSFLEKKPKKDYFQKGASPKSLTKKIGIISAGQSNIDGRNALSELPSYISNPIPNVHFLKSDSGTFTDSYTVPARWGFDTVVYHNLSQTAGKEIYVMKKSMGGTSIDPTGATDYHWTADYEKLDNISYSLLYEFEKVIRNGVEQSGTDFDIQAFLWHQGEGDRASHSSIASKNYYTNLTNVIDYIRGVVGNKRLPFVTGTVSHSSAEYDPQVEQALLDIASEDPYFYLVDLHDAELFDPYHFNAEWSEYFGKKAYDCLIDAGVINASKINPIKPS